MARAMEPGVLHYTCSQDALKWKAMRFLSKHPRAPQGTPNKEITNKFKLN